MRIYSEGEDSAGTEWVKVTRLISEVHRARSRRTQASRRTPSLQQSSVIVTIDLDRNAHFLFAWPLGTFREGCQLGDHPWRGGETSVGGGRVGSKAA